MKKKRIIALFPLILILSATTVFGGASSVGIIGGADGPTEIYITKDETEYRDDTYDLWEEQKAGKGSFQVMVNGSYLDLGDAKPIEDSANVIMVPARPVLEALDLSFTFDCDSQRYLIQRGTDQSIILQEGAPFAIGKISGRPLYFKLAEAPYIDPATNLLYIEIQQIAQILGIAVNYESDWKTLVLLDYAPYLTSAKEDFSILLGALQSSVHADQDAKVQLALNGTYRLSQSTGRISLVGEGQHADGVHSYKIMFFYSENDATDIPSETSQAFTLAGYGGLMGERGMLEVELILDEDMRKVYFTSPQYIQNYGLDPGTWVCYDLSERGFQVKPENRTIKTDLHGILSTIDVGVASHFQLNRIYSQMYAILGNEAFDSQQQGKATVHVLKSLQTPSPYYTGAFTITERAGKPSVLDFSIKAPENGYSYGLEYYDDIDWELGLRGHMDHLKGRFRWIGAGFDADFSLKYKAQRLRGKEKISIPSEAKVVDYDDVMYYN